MGGLLPARPDSAGVFVPGGRGVALLDCQPPGEGRDLRQDVRRTRLWRALVLIALGIFLRSLHSPQTNFTFEDTLTQIGLGYAFLFLLGFRSPRWQWTALAVILFGLLAGLGVLSGARALAFNWQAVGVPANWTHFYTGFAAHWNKNSNLGQAFDLWFLNLFPRPKPFALQRGWIFDAQLHSDPGHDDSGLGCRPMAARRRASNSHETPADRRRDRHRGRPFAARHRHLPGGEAHLDARVGRCSAGERVSCFWRDSVG